MAKKAAKVHLSSTMRDRIDIELRHLKNAETLNDREIARIAALEDVLAWADMSWLEVDVARELAKRPEKMRRLKRATKAGK